MGIHPNTPSFELSRYPTGLVEILGPNRGSQTHFGIVGTPDHIVRQFEAETLAMPRYIGAIRNWRLSRVTKATGARAWTHVWEQEYADPGGLLGPYMTNPYHWARVDRWFDPECPEHIVDTRLCHSFCAIGRSVLRPY